MKPAPVLPARTPSIASTVRRPGERGIALVAALLVLLVLSVIAAALML